jgi:hypothetical protein
MRRFSGLYMNEDPDAPNYDPKNKVIKSIWTGSKGPMMHKATIYDWVGDPVPGKFHLLHNSAGRSKLLDLEAWYPRMLAHCEEYIDSVGDNSLNLVATILSLNTYALTHDKKYRDWTLEYVNAWKERTEQTGGMVPSNVGLDGTPGGEYNGQWWKGTYGWNFTIFDGELEQIAHRNSFLVGPWSGFAHALLLTGDQAYVDVLRRQLDKLYEHKKVENGRTLLPQMYGDPRGYKYDGKPEFYHYTPNLFTDRLAEIYFWSMKRSDLERVPKEGWIGSLEGNDPGYPEKALSGDFASIRRTMEQIRNDGTTADTRLADYLLRFNPVQTNSLVNLMIGGYFSRGRIWTLHSRLRYFDPEKRRAGVPEDVASLVHSLSDDSVSVTLVNVNQVEARPVMVQAGAYGEHQFLEATVNGKNTPINDAVFLVRLAPGAGARIELKQKRYANQPTLAQPWDRGWMVKQ